MVLKSVDALIDALCKTQILSDDQLHVLTSQIAPKYSDPQDLAKHLVHIGWLTLYQAKKLISGHGAELVLGHFVVLDKLGEGGMGKVYKALQLRLNRIVALKVVRPHLLANEMALKRFHREAKAAAQLTHPNIVRLFDADQAGERHFLAMEFIEGIDLTKLVKETGPLPIGMACSFMRQAAMGLQHAHDRGLVHRDIKPSNLFVSSPSTTGKKVTGGIIKILDMGLARAMTQADDDSVLTALTQDGAVIGTPDFMSPEQGRNSSDVDARSDLYSLGCTLYYLLAAQTPFPHGTTLEKLLQHQIDPPPHINLMRPDVPEGVARLIHCLLEKDPDNRYQTGDELAKALEAWSVFDPSNQRLTASGKHPRPDIVPQALLLPMPSESEEIVEEAEREPFNFDSVMEPMPSEADSSQMDSQAESVAGLPAQNGTRWWFVFSVALATFAIGGILAVKHFAGSR